MREAFEEEIEVELERERTKFEKEKHLLQVGITSSCLFNGSLRFNLIGFLRPCLSAWVLGDTCSYCSLVSCNWTVYVADFRLWYIESTLGNLTFADYHKSRYVPADCSMCISFTSVVVATFTRASFALLAQRTNGKEILRNCSYFSVDHGVNQSVSQAIIYL